MAIRTIADAVAAEQDGRVWYGFVRKTGPAVVGNTYSDMNYSAGIPVANYYASAPLIGVTPGEFDGVNLGPTPPAGMKKYLSTAFFAPTSVVGVSTVELVDICQYYPFLDGDGGFQAVSTPTPVTRYNGGEGCRLMAISQGAGTGIVTATVTYTNCAGVAGKTVNVECNLSFAAGRVVTSSPANTGTFGTGLYGAMATGCRGIRSIQSIEYLTGGGGIQAWLIVRPLLQVNGFEATGVGTEVDCISDRSFLLPEIGDGAYMGIFLRAATGVGSSATLGYVKTIWG